MKLIHGQQTLRLRGYDYATPGWYFITVTVVRRRHLFGRIRDDQVTLSRLGQVVVSEWDASFDARPWISCDAFVVMPDHLHALVGWERTPGNRPADLGRMVGAFKAGVTRRARREKLLRPWETLWDRGYWDRIVQSPSARERIIRYIEQNPAKAGG